MKKVLAVIVALFATLPASAQTFGLHLGSQHDPDPGGRANNLNPGAYVRFDNGFTAGFYKNSLHKDTAYVGWTTPEFARLSISAGAASGYRDETLIPFAILTMRAATFYFVPGEPWPKFTRDATKIGAYSLRFGFIPKIEEKGVNVYHLMIERRF